MQQPMLGAACTVSKCSSIRHNKQRSRVLRQEGEGGAQS